MSNYNSLKTTIDANIKQNGRQEIKGQTLNSVLNAMVTTLGAGYQFAGVATIATNPGTPDAKVFYIANGKGTYEKFGGLEVTEDDVVVFYYDTAWHKVSTGIASQAKLSELNNKIGEKLGIYDETMSGGVTNYASVFNNPFAEDTKIIHIKAKGEFYGGKLRYAIVGLSDGIITSIEKNEIKVSSGTIIDDDVNIVIPAGKILFVIGCSWRHSENVVYYSNLDALNVACGTFKLAQSIEIQVLSDSQLKAYCENLTKYSNSTLNTYIKKENKNNPYDISSWTREISNDDIYYQKVNYTGKLTKIKVKVTRPQTIVFYSCDIDTTTPVPTQKNKTLIGSIDVISGEHEYDLSSLNIEITSEKYIGAKFPNGYTFNNISGTFIFFRERANDDISNTNVTSAIEFYVYEETHVVDFDIEQLAKLIDSLENNSPQQLIPMVNELRENVDELQLSINKLEPLKNFYWGKIYASSNFSDWTDWDNDNRGSWIKEQNTIRPTALGGYVDNYICGGIVLNQMYQSSWKRYLFDVVLHSDTILNIHFARGIQTGHMPNESMFVINCANSKLQMMSNENRFITTNVFSEKDIDIPIINAGSYIVDISRIDTTFQLKLIDKTTGQSVALTNANNWNAGTMQDRIGFTWGAGTTPPAISNVRIYEPQNVDIIFVGDSITEGYGMLENLSKRYDALCLNDIKNSFISAASSDTIGDAAGRMTNELSKNKPKRLCVLLGTNNVDSSITALTQLFTELKTACDSLGIELILNHIPMLQGKTNECIALNNVIDTFNLDGAKFDIATAINNNPVNGCDTSLFVDGCHPNVLGSKKMYERMRIDLPYLFDD